MKSNASHWPVKLVWVVVAALPLVGLVSLLARSKLDPNWTNHRLHFVLFLSVGLAVCLLAYAAGEAADRRGDARVFLLSVAFLATGCFLTLHALGTPGILLSQTLCGFKVAIPVGLLVAAVFSSASAFVDLNPAFAGAVMRRRRALRGSVLVAVGVWSWWSLAQWPPLTSSGSEGAANSTLALLAGVGTVVYGVSAIRYLFVFRGRLGLLPASVVACFVLLAEAMIGVAVTGERDWHASWWEWHALIVTAYLIILYAARRRWRDERFRCLYLATTQERKQEISVLFSDLVGFTPFTEHSEPGVAAEMLNAYYAAAAPLISRRFGGEVEKFMGDGIMATFNTCGGQPDHALRAASAALALQREQTRLTPEHPGWPQLRVGVNSGNAVIREMGGGGYVAYVAVGDMVNLASRLERQAPTGTVLIGDGTYRRLPGGADVDASPALKVKGHDGMVNAYVLNALPHGVETVKSIPWAYRRKHAARSPQGGALGRQ